MEATLLLCDAAVGDNAGKLHILGAGWSVTSTPTAPAAVAVFLKVPWDRTNQKIPLALYLCDADGQRVTIGSEKLGIDQTFEVGRPPGLAAGSNIDHAFQLTLGPLPLEPGRYQWRLTVGGDDFSISFEVRGAGGA